MQSFNEQSEEHKNEPVVETGSDEGMEPSSPLYEFPADMPAPAASSPDTFQLVPETRILAGEEHVQQPSEEDFRSGLVYPPPPSYYQNLQGPLDRPPLPESQMTNGPVVHPQNIYGPPAYSVGIPGTQAPPFPPPQLAGSQPPVKRSRKWVWIIISIFAAAFLVSCGLCSWAFYSLFNTTFQHVSGATNIAQDYYKDIQNRDYIDAYKYLQVSNLPLATFIQQAQSSDTQNGVVQSFTVEQPSFTTNPNSGPDLSQWRITVDVTREKASYPVLLTVHETDNAWKITYFDKI